MNTFQLLPLTHNSTDTHKDLQYSTYSNPEKYTRDQNQEVYPLHSVGEEEERNISHQAALRECEWRAWMGTFLHCAALAAAAGEAAGRQQARRKCRRDGPLAKQSTTLQVGSFDINGTVSSFCCRGICRLRCREPLSARRHGHDEPQISRRR